MDAVSEDLLLMYEDEAGQWAVDRNELHLWFDYEMSH